MERRKTYAKGLDNSGNIESISHAVWGGGACILRHWRVRRWGRRARRAPPDDAEPRRWGRLVHQVTQVLALDCVPFFLTDGFREYLTALVTHYGQWLQPARRQAKGPRPKPRWMLQPRLLYAQVVKSYRRRRIVGVKHRVVFGTPEVIHDMLAKRGWNINPAFVERLNLDFRHHVAAIGRRVNTLCKHEAGLRHQLALFHVYHNFVLPHASLRLPLPNAPHGAGTVKRWQQRAPAMAAGLTDHIWRLHEVLMCRVPPWPQPQVG